MSETYCHTNTSCYDLIHFRLGFCFILVRGPKILRMLKISIRPINEVRSMLLKLRKFEEEQGGHLIEEMNGEIIALEWVLEDKDELF